MPTSIADIRSRFEGQLAGAVKTGQEQLAGAVKAGQGAVNGTVRTLSGTLERVLREARSRTTSHRD